MAKAKIAAKGPEKAVVVVTMTSHKCRHCGEPIPSNQIQPVRATFNVDPSRPQKSNTRMVFYIKGHESKA